MKYKHLLIYILICIYCCIKPSVIDAGINVYPGVIEVVALRGQEVSQKITVENVSKFKANINIFAGKFTTEDISTSDWVTIEPKVFELEPGTAKELYCKFKPPEESEGELRARMYISSKEIGKGSSPISIRLNMAVYVAIQNTVKLDVQIERINTSYNPITNEIEGGILLNNKSNVHIRPEIKLIVNDLENNLLGEIKIPFGQPAQKEQKRFFIFKDNIKLAPGRYKIIANVNYGKFYGQNDFIATKETEFEVKPEGRINTDLETQINTDKGGSK